MELTVGNLVKWFQLKYPEIVKLMHDSSHHFKEGEILNPYHLEGDVWTHNMMVMLEANRLKSRTDHNVFDHVLVCALLHDIGKPVARKESKDKDRVHFWGHEPLSAFLAVPIVDAISKDFNVKLNKQLIIETIAMHTDVYNIPREKLKDRLISNPTLALLLHHLSECDYAGRFFEMGERDMLPINPDYTSEIFGDDAPQLICYVGLPCSGKSTHIKALLQDAIPFSILSRDDIVMELAEAGGITDYNTAFKEVNQKEVDRLFQKRKKALITLGSNVIIDMTNMGRKSRRKNMQGFKGYTKTAQVMMTPLEVIRKRNKEREGKSIPQDVYKRMMTSFQPPLYDEFDYIYWSFNG